MKNLSEYKEKYHKLGIVVIPSVFTSEECDRIKKEAYLISDDDIKNSGYPHVPSETSKNKKSLIFFPCLANEYINSIRTDNRLSNIVKFFLGDNVKQINNQIYFRESGDLDEFAWHQDIMFRETKNFNSSVETNYLQTIIAIDDITEDNGPIEFIEESHNLGKIEPPLNLRQFNRMGMSGKKYMAKKGDVLIWSSMTIHGSELNKSNGSRMTYMNGYCSYDSTNNYPDYLVNGEIVSKINPKLIP
jgi:ectoine hydroxylase-related dioxygenase (phytanoyl-CoA dioxygenase family)